MTLTTANTAPEELERIAFDRQTARLRTATPGIITAVHPNGTVDVQPAIMQVTTLDGVRSDEPLSVLTGVPTIFTYYAQTLGLSIILTANRLQYQPLNLQAILFELYSCISISIVRQ